MWEFIKNNTFALTIFFIVLATLIAAFVRRVRRDKCLQDFKRFRVTLEMTNGQTISGDLQVENTGLEFVYPVAEKTEAGPVEASYILYKNEYPTIQALIRYHDDLSEHHKQERQKDLERTYHPNFLRRLKRKILNIFKTVRDSVAEVVNLMVSQVQKKTSAGAVLSSQSKYVDQMKQELIGAAGTSYEPLLEKYIGHKVIMEFLKGDNIHKLTGVLKEYTSEFVEIMDVHYQVQEEQSGKADLVVLRKYGVVRHLGE